MAKGDMSAEEYHAKHGYKSHQEPDWSNLSNQDRDAIKDQRPFFQPPGAEETGLAADWLEQLRAGPQTNIWQGLSKMLGYKPGAIKKFTMGKFMDLMKKPDFGKEYGLSKKALDEQLAETERKMASQFAARGLLSSSARAQAVGGAVGGYSRSLADLMMGRAGMEEQARATRFNQGMGMVGTGMNFADFLNTQYLQKMGLGGEAINYLAGNRQQENIFNLQRYGINPNINDPITTGEGLMMGAAGAGSIYSAFTGGGGGYNFDWGDYGGGGGAPGESNPWGYMEDWYQ